MKQLIGSDVGSYIFDPTNKLIHLIDAPTISLFNLLLITNVTVGTILYNFADTSLNADVNSNLISLEYDTTGMNANDVLQIWLDIPVADECAPLLRRVLEALYSPAGHDASLNRLRQTAIIESGTITTVTTLTTCNTVSNLSSIDGRNGAMFVNAMDELAFIAAVRDKIA